MADSVLRRDDGAVATITINRPEARNALTAETKVALLRALRGCSADESIRAVVLTGAGQAFCSGQDLREHAAGLLAAGDTAHWTRSVSTTTPRSRPSPPCPSPVIAALPGTWPAVRRSLAFACDFRIAAERASFMLAFARVGLGADSGASWTLQRLLGTARATELLMLAEPVNAATALQLGLLTSVVPDADLPVAAGEFAARLAAGPTLAYAAIKESLLYGAAHRLQRVPGERGWPPGQARPERGPPERHPGLRGQADARLPRPLGGERGVSGPAGVRRPRG